MNKTLGPFGQGYRLRFIEKMLLHYGTLNRSILSDYFGISTPQASLDIQAYIALAPRNVEYDMSNKTYRQSGTFKQVFK